MPGKSFCLLIVLPIEDLAIRSMERFRINYESNGQCCGTSLTEDKEIVVCDTKNKVQGQNDLIGQNKGD